MESILTLCRGLAVFGTDRLESEVAHICKVHVVDCHSPATFGGTVAAKASAQSAVRKTNLISVKKE